MMLLVTSDPCAFVSGSAETDSVDAGYGFFSRNSVASSIMART